MVSAIVLILLVAVLSVLNVDPVPVNFGFTQVEWPLILVIFGALLIGALIASLFSTVKMYQETKRRKEMQKKLDAADQTQKQKVKETEESYQDKITQLQKDLDEEKQHSRELERKLANTQTTQDTL